MVPYYGDFAEDDTVNIIFNAFTSDDPSASATITNFINTDVHIHKDLGLTQRNNAAGVTVSVDFDGITGNHAIAIDTSDDTVGGFWVTGSEYQVRIEGTTVDGATVNAWVGSFSIERAGGTVALLKLIQAAVITNAAGADIAADIIAVKAETASILTDTGTTLENRLIAIEADTDVIDDVTSGLVKIASDVAAILVDTGTTLENRLIAIEADTDELQTDDYPTSIAAVKADTAAILTDTGTTLENRLIAIEADTDVIDDVTSGLVKIASDVAAILVDTGTTLENRLIAIEADTDVIDDGTSGLVKIASDVAAVLVDTGTTLPAEHAALPTAAENTAAILAGIVEGTTTLKQSLQAVMAFCAGIAAGGGTTSITFRDQADSKNRLTMTVDSNGNRTVVTPSYD